MKLRRNQKEVFFPIELSLPTKLGPPPPFRPSLPPFSRSRYPSLCPIIFLASSLLVSLWQYGTILSPCNLSLLAPLAGIRSNRRHLDAIPNQQVCLSLSISPLSPSSHFLSDNLMFRKDTLWALIQRSSQFSFFFLSELLFLFFGFRIVNPNFTRLVFCCPTFSWVKTDTSFCLFL